MNEDKEKKFPSGKWREKYECKILKGEHVFELTIPDFFFARSKTVEEYYSQKKKEIEEDKKLGRNKWSLFWGILWYYRCQACGKKELEWGEKTNKRIKNRIKNEIRS